MSFLLLLLRVTATPEPNTQKEDCSRYLDPVFTCSNENLVSALNTNRLASKHCCVLTLNAIPGR